MFLLWVIGVVIYYVENIGFYLGYYVSFLENSEGVGVVFERKEYYFKFVEICIKVYVSICI